jgi:hypothetical protein
MRWTIVALALTLLLTLLLGPAAAHHGKGSHAEPTPTPTPSESPSPTEVCSEDPAGAFPPAGAYWHADHEAGLPLAAAGSQTKWHGFTPSGTAWEELGTAPTDPAIGNHSLELNADVTSDLSSGIRSRVEDNITGSSDPLLNLPDEGFYSAWYCVPPGEGAWNSTGTPNWNIFQFKEFDAAAPTMRLLYFMRADWMPADGDYQLEARADMNLQTGEWPDAPTTKIADSGALRLEENEWTHLQWYVDRDTAGNGTLTAWIDGQQWMHVTGIHTEVGFGVPRGDGSYFQWTVNNYMTQGGAAHEREVTRVFVDNATVTAEWVGP